jgi:anti-anti-sigma regulatory factor
VKPLAAKRGSAPRESRVALGEDLRIGRAREVHAALSKVKPKVTVVIDASAVSRVDAAGLQAIAACVVQWRTAGRAWRWDNPAQTLRAAASLAGLDATLGLP